MITASKLIAASAFLDSPVIEIETMCKEIATTASTTGEKRDLAPINSEIIVDFRRRQPTSPADIGWFNSNTYHSKSAFEKLNDLWCQCLREATNIPEPASYDLEEIFSASHAQIFSSTSDETPGGFGYGNSS